MSSSTGTRGSASGSGLEMIEPGRGNRANCVQRICDIIYTNLTQKHMQVHNKYTQGLLNSSKPRRDVLYRRYTTCQPAKVSEREGTTQRSRCLIRSIVTNVMCQARTKYYALLHIGRAEISYDPRRHPRDYWSIKPGKGSYIWNEMTLTCP